MILVQPSDMHFQSRKAAQSESTLKKESEIVVIIADADWKSAGEALLTLRPTLDIEAFVSNQGRLVTDGYRMIGVRAEGRILSVASFTISPHAMLGRELLVHDMATLKEAERRGYASLLLKELEKIAHREGCGRIFVHTRQAQKLYAKNGFLEYSTGMIRVITSQNK